MALRIQLREVQTLTVVDLRGDLTFPDLNEFQLLFPQLMANCQKRILLNLQDVVSIDSAGIGALIAARTAVQKAAGEIKLLNAKDRHVDLFVLSRVAPLFPSFNDEKTAIVSFASGERAVKQFDILEFIRSEEEKDSPIEANESADSAQ